MPAAGLRILVGADVPPDPNSGAAGTVVATNEALRRLGHRVDAFWSDSLSHRIRHGNLHYLLELPRAYRSIVARRAEGVHYDVIQLSQPHAWLAAKDHRARQGRGIFINRSHGLESMADSATRYWHRKLGIPENRLPRSLFTNLIRRRLHRHIDLIVRYADGIIVPAADIREHLVEQHGADPQRVAVIPHGIPDAFLAGPLPDMTPERAKRLLHVGQFAFIKGPHLLVRAAEAIFARDPDVQLTWVCAKAHHGAVQELFRPEFRARITLVDWMPQNALIDVYDRHGVFLAHSLYEGAAKACTDAMARGLGVVTSAVGALKEHIEDGRNGFLVEVGDTERMAAIALRLANDFSTLTRIGISSRSSVSHMSWIDCAEQAVKFYWKIMNK